MKGELRAAEFRGFKVTPPKYDPRDGEQVRPSLTVVTLALETSAELVKHLGTLQANGGPVEVSLEAIQPELFQRELEEARRRTAPLLGG